VAQRIPATLQDWMSCAVLCCAVLCSLQIWELMYDTVDATHDCVRIATGVLSTLSINPDRMMKVRPAVLLIGLSQISPHQGPAGHLGPVLGRFSGIWEGSGAQSFARHAAILPQLSTLGRSVSPHAAVVIRRASVINALRRLLT
jgi:hypothetical protein